MFKTETPAYRGKVRDVYFLGEKIVMIASDRISAFDVILPRNIPHKGQVLTQIAEFFLKETADVVPNWLEKCPFPNVSYGKRCEAIPVEMVIRGYLAGHAWREYKAGKRVICGEKMPEGMKEGDKFPTPIITPTGKAQEGHDEDTSKEEILKNGIVSRDLYEVMEKYTHALYAKGCETAAKKGLILADTKYEFGVFDGKILLMDEVHTPDSSRYYYADGYTEKQKKGEKQVQLSKEFVREWLMENGFQGKEGQQVPEMTDEVVEKISARYIQLYELLTGQKFVPVQVEKSQIEAYFSTIS